MEIIQVVQPALNNASVVKVRQDSGYSGKSAYDIWLEQGNTGTEADFLDSLKGQDGLAGEAATITVGIVQTVPYTNTATVTNSGDQYNAIFNFGIPRGESGKTIVSPTPPPNPYEGLQWFNSSTGNTYIYYDGFWVQDANALISGSSGPNLYTIDGTLTSTRTVTMANFGLTFTGGTIYADKISVGGTGADAMFSVYGNNTTWGTASLHSTKGTQVSHIHYGTNGDIYLRSASTAGVVALQTAGGNVLIGTLTDAGYKFDVNGTSRFQNDVTIADNRVLYSSRSSAGSWVDFTSSVDGFITMKLTNSNTGIAAAAGLRLYSDNGLKTNILLGSSNNAILGSNGFVIDQLTNNLQLLARTGDIQLSTVTYGQYKLIVKNNGNIIIGGTTDNGYKLEVNGTGNYTSTLTASSFVKAGGTASQFLKADGSVDSTAYTPSSRTLTINGTTFDLTANRSWTITAGVWGQITGTLSTQTDLQTALDAKVPTSRTLTINGTTFDLSADRSWTIASSASLSGLTDVTITTPVLNQTLVYNGTKWVNAGSTSSPSSNLFNYYNFI